jgi:hypothetical protein
MFEEGTGESGNEIGGRKHGVTEADDLVELEVTEVGQSRYPKGERRNGHEGEGDADPFDHAGTVPVRCVVIDGGPDTCNGFTTNRATLNGREPISPRTTHVARSLHEEPSSDWAGHARLVRGDSHRA